MNMDNRLIGHQAQWTYLQRLQENALLNHAYLFVGPRSCGGSTLMRLFVSSLQPVETIELSAQDEEKKRPFISVEQIRDLKERLSYTTIQEGKRVVLLYDAGQLSTESSNALLKILEEPPSGVIFLLRASVRSLVLPTILSRCSIIQLSHPHFSRNELSLIAKTHNEVDIDQCMELAHGRIGKALAYLFSMPERNAAVQRKKIRSDFRTLPLANRLIQNESFSDELICEWLMELEESILSKRIFSQHTVKEYEALLAARKEGMRSVREQSVYDAFCLRAE